MTLPFLKKKMKMINFRWSFIRTEVWVFCNTQSSHTVTKWKEPPVWRDPFAALEQDVLEPRVNDQKMSRVWAKNQIVELSRELSTSCWMFTTWKTSVWSITTCLLHSSKRERLTWTFLERFMTFTSIWSRLVHFAFRRNRDQTDHVWVGYEQKNLEILSSWMMALQTLEIKLLDYWSFWMVLLHTWQHIHVRVPLHQKSFSKLHEWMDTFQKNPKAIRANMTFHHPHDMQAFYRMHNIEWFPAGPHTPWPNRAEMCVRLFEKFLSALVDTASKNLDKNICHTSHLPSWCAKQRRWNHTGFSEWRNAFGFSHRKETKRFHGLRIHDSKISDIHTNQTRLTQREHSKVGYENKFRGPTTRRHSTRSYWRNDICSSQSSTGRTSVLKATRSEQSSARTKIWKMVAGKGPMVVIIIGTSILQVNDSKLRRPLDTADLEESPGSCEQTWAPVFFLSCEGQTDVWELFSDNSYLRAVLDRKGLMVAAPADLRIKKADSFSPQLFQGFWSRIKIKNPNVVVMSPTVFTKYNIQKEVIWQQYPRCLAIADNQILDRKYFLILGSKSGKIWWLKKAQYRQKKYHCQRTLLRGRQPKCFFSQNFWRSSSSTWVCTDFAWASRSNRMASSFSSWRLKIEGKSDFNSSFTVSTISADQWLPGSCKFEHTKGSNTGHELDQGPTWRVETLEPSAGHYYRPGNTQLSR